MPDKTYVIDTSVLIADPQAITSFAEHKVVIPLVVLKELERKRTDPLIGHLARRALHMIDTLGVSIAGGAKVNDAGGLARIEINHVDQTDLPAALTRDGGNDTRILAVAKNLSKEGLEVALVTRDMPLRLLAQSINLPAEDYRSDRATDDADLSGLITIDVGTDEIDDLHTDTAIALKDYVEDVTALPKRTGVVLRGPGSSSSGLGVSDAHGNVTLVRQQDAFGLQGKSAPQKIAIDHLLNPDVGVVSLGGPAGTGKTILAIAAGLEQVMEQKRYKQIVIFRPMHAVGQQDIGFLPGDVGEKFQPYTAAIYDTLGNLTSEVVVDEVKDRGLIDMQPVTFIRGRTLGPDTYVIVDEAQNLEREVLLSVLSRAGEGTKMVLCWDAAQRDNLHLGPQDGIVNVVARLQPEPLFAHVTLTKSERSAVAEMATRVLGS